MGADRTTERVPVVILKRTDTAVLVEAALAEADQIVSEGADLVRTGVPLRPPGRDAASGGASSR